MSETLPPDLDETPPHGTPAVVDTPAERVRVTRSRALHARPAGGAHYEVGYRRRGGRITGRGRLVLAVIVVVIALIGLGAWYEVESHPFGAKGAAVVLTVRPGESTSSVESALTAKGIIASSLAFRLWTVFHGQPTIRPGTYELHQNEPFATVKSELLAGPNVYTVDVAPGNTLAEVAKNLSALPGGIATPFLKDARTGVVRSPYQPTPGATLEGLIGSGSYQVRPDESAQQLLTAMVDRFDAEAAKAGLTPTTTVDGLTPYQVVTTASIAVKEGYYERYFGPVVRVIYNRLRYGMPLDMTSTVLYSLGQDGGQVTLTEERQTTPYNTYLHAGLTPTPICTPSETALAAAVAPPSGTWLYFDLVTAKKGTMVFSTTFTGQVQAEREAQANATAQRGTATAT